MEYFRDPMKPLYFDYAATTPVDQRVVDAMNPYHTDVFYNASSSHKGGLEAQKAVMKSRMTIAKHIGSKMSEIYFTSGATEAINLAVNIVISTFYNTNILHLRTCFNRFWSTFNKNSDIDFIEIC